MIAADTNVLVRILADDPGQPAQVEAARGLASQAKQVFIPLVVQVETVWVLESGYFWGSFATILPLSSRITLKQRETERVEVVLNG